MKRKPITAEDLLKQLRGNPEFVANSIEKELQEREALQAERLESAQLIAELDSIGVEVGSVWDLVNRKNDYAAALPVLHRHLMMDRYSAGIREGITRSLALREAHPYLADFVKLYAATEDESLRQGLAAAISAAARSADFEVLLELLADSALGQSRGMFIRNLAKVKDPRVDAVVCDMKNGEFSKEIGRFKRWRE